MLLLPLRLLRVAVALQGLLQHGLRALQLSLRLRQQLAAGPPLGLAHEAGELGLTGSRS